MSPRVAALVDWRALAGEAAACAIDPHHPVQTLKAIARPGREGFLWPGENREDNAALTGLRGLAYAYALQHSVRRRGRMGTALAAMATIADEILATYAPAEAGDPGPPPTPYYLREE